MADAQNAADLAMHKPNEISSQQVRFRQVVSYLLIVRSGTKDTDELWTPFRHRVIANYGPESVRSEQASTLLLDTASGIAITAAMLNRLSCIRLSVTQGGGSTKGRTVHGGGSTWGVPVPGARHCIHAQQLRQTNSPHTESVSSDESIRVANTDDNSAR